MFQNTDVNEDFAAVVDAIDVPRITWASPGSAAGLRQLENFIANGLVDYVNCSNPSLDCVSKLSPWLHFGRENALISNIDKLN